MFRRIKNFVSLVFSSVMYVKNEVLGQDTTDLYAAKFKDKETIWTPQRKKKHEEIIKTILNRGVCRRKPVAVFMGGGSASGKSEVREHITTPWNYYRRRGYMS
ncbi:MAG: hypothetical protein KGZ63_11340 [Clostridiales bacterium]|jgi:2-phosphoglycerate kinase|nr:hypothetical protein [Clostridiales bacterium]